MPRDASGISIVGKWGLGGAYVPPPGPITGQVKLCFCGREFVHPVRDGEEVSCPHCGREYVVRRGPRPGDFYAERRR
jgi:DNA-directed RNA polymerase subunit RPC12/RpoP